MARLLLLKTFFGAIPMHSTGVALACLLVSAASVFGIGLPSIVCLILLVSSVALIGVPHGGLDHWTGRRLLGKRFPRHWAAVFFPAYLAAGLMVVVGWNFIPLVTAIGFFLISAWHFGLEDEQPDLPSSLFRNLVAIAVGGMVIWIPVLAQPMRVESLLTSIVPSELVESAGTIVSTTGWIAICMLPIAALVVARDMVSTDSRGRAVRNSCFAVLFTTADVLLSFGIYFCGWHSIRGLKRLARDHEKSIVEVLLAAMPLSLGAISLAVAGIWFWSSGQILTDAMTRTLFVALSAIAVPHLLLHGPMTEIAVQRTGSRRVRLQSAEVLP